MNKKGIDQKFSWLGFGIIIAIVVVIIVFISSLGYSSWGAITNTFETAMNEGQSGISTLLQVDTPILKMTTNVIGLLVGKVPNALLNYTDSNIAAVLIIIALAVMLALAFGDILKNFSGFTNWVAWTMGILLAVVAVNLKVSAAIILFMTAIFAPLGVFAVYLGLGAAFFAFVMVELGITKFAPFIQNRKSMRLINESKSDSKIGATTITNALDILTKVGSQVEKEGKKKK